MGSWGWLVEVFPMKEGSRYAWPMSGARSAMMVGAVQMPPLFVVNWDIPQQVRVMVIDLSWLDRHALTILPPTDAVAFSNAHFGAGTGSQFLDEVACTGSETMLTSCSSASSIYCYNGHNEDAGVRCQSEYVMADNLTTLMKLIIQI